MIRRPREQESLRFEETEIQLFQDLSPITLQKRKALKPLLTALRSQGILYRGAFPSPYLQLRKAARRSYSHHVTCRIFATPCRYRLWGSRIGTEMALTVGGPRIRYRLMRPELRARDPDAGSPDDAKGQWTGPRTQRPP